MGLLGLVYLAGEESTVTRDKAHVRGRSAHVRMSNTALSQATAIKSKSMYNEDPNLESRSKPGRGIGAEWRDHRKGKSLCISNYPLVIDIHDCCRMCLSPWVLHSEAAGLGCGSCKSLPSRNPSFPFHLASLTHL